MVMYTLLMYSQSGVFNHGLGVQADEHSQSGVFTMDFVFKLMNTLVWRVHHGLDVQTDVHSWSGVFTMDWMFKLMYTVGLECSLSSGNEAVTLYEATKPPPDW
ncbi:hypothetical protein Hamer_G004457 [Homarus americanus]|uniref:Uncharacterized protein n=1 Tax=Homarus americanus TaxID=6706 RepID=A0A8J5JSF7_HOMAM|nr:hypothetical protein Hamer_G004457 [Homarus americanus]